MADKLLFIFTQKLAVLFVGGLSVLGGLLTMGTVPHTPQVALATVPAVPQMAIIANNNALVANAAAANSTSTTANLLPMVPLDLLPTTTIPFCPMTATSTCGRKNLRKLIQLSATPSVTKHSASSAVTAAVAPVAPLPPVAVPQIITAQSFLADTTSSLKILLNGLDELVFTTNPGGGQAPLIWGLLTATVGGLGSVPTFSMTSSCTPAPRPADPGALDKNPTFAVRTAYDCSISLTPTTGTNRVTQSKTFSFATPTGQLVVMSDPSMSPLLIDNTNNGGIVFNNQDTNPVTVTGVTFDASYSYISTLNGPLVLRFENPATGQSFVDYHLENIPSSASGSYTHSQSGITLPLSFTIPPLTQKMLPIQVLGVDRMGVLGTTPSITVNLRGITTNATSNIKEILNNPSVVWSCVVSTASYDPNATDSAYATGQACLN